MEVFSRPPGGQAPSLIAHPEPLRLAGVFLILALGIR
jgi:hypothetical protein